MKTRMGKFDRDAGTVRVSFTDGDRGHVRDVNAVLTAEGEIDAKAMAERIAEVAAGVTHKFEAGLLGGPED